METAQGPSPGYPQFLQVHPIWYSSALDFNGLFTRAVTPRGGDGPRGFDVGQRGAISLTGWQALISCFLCSPALPPAVPMTFAYRHTLPSSRARQRVPSGDRPSDGVLLRQSCLHESPGLRCPQGHSRCLPLCPSWLLAPHHVCHPDTCLEGATLLATSALPPGLFRNQDLESSRE